MSELLERVCSLVLSCDAVRYRVPEADDAKALAACIRVDVAREFATQVRQELVRRLMAADEDPGGALFANTTNAESWRCVKCELC